MDNRSTVSLKRIDELDFIKGILIVLMVAFHLVYIGEHYTYAKQVVYTFHMPAFLVISGYLMKTDRSTRRFLQTMWWIALPYLIMETAYTLMAARLPIREHIDVLTAEVVFEKVLLHPLGPYWYLHTMIICGLTVHITGLFFKKNTLSRLIATALLLFILAKKADVLSVANSFYFLSGAAIRLYGKEFLHIVRPSKWAIIALIVLCSMPDNLNRATIEGVFIVYLSLSMMLASYPLIMGKMRECTLFIGRNTLLVVLFSPIFTILCKQLIPLLQFDNTRLVFLIAALIITVGGSIAIGLLFDKMKLSRWFFGKTNVIN